MVEVAPRIYRVGSWAVNWWLVEDGGRITVVDAGLPRQWGRLERELAAIGASLADVETVLLTHAHPDHTGSAERLRLASGAVVRMHPAETAVAREQKRPRRPASMPLRAALRDALRPLFWRFMAATIRDMGPRIGSPPIRELATFEDGELLDVPGHPRVIHTPGHTAGSCCLLLEERSALFTGDALVTLNGDRLPRRSSLLFNADHAEALRSLDRLDGIAASVLLPGHGEPWTGGVAEALRLARAAAP